VSEAESAEGSGNVLDDTGGNCFVEHAEEHVDAPVVGDPFEGNELDLATEDRPE
jgi:hypothetical protein